MVEARERVAERRLRRCVQPLNVVDREAQRTVAGEQSQRSEEGGGDRAVISADLRLPEQQRCLERPPLDRRQLGQDVPAAASPRRSVSPANENVASASAGRADRTRYPLAAAASTPASHSVVLPIPASPDSTAALGSSSRASRSRTMASSSSSLPTSIGAVRGRFVFCAGVEPRSQVRDKRRDRCLSSLNRLPDES